MYQTKASPIGSVAQREQETCKQMKRKGKVGQEIDGIC